MTAALIGSLVLTIAGFLVLMDRKDRRAYEEQAANRLERTGLLQRIQAPEAAVIQHQIQEFTEQPPQPPVNDEAYWAEIEGRANAIAELEARENAPWDRVS